MGGKGKKGKNEKPAEKSTEEAVPVKKGDSKE